MKFLLEKARICILNCIARERGAEVQDRMLLQQAVEVRILCVVDPIQRLPGRFSLKWVTTMQTRNWMWYSNQLQKFIIEHAGDFYKRQSRVVDGSRFVPELPWKGICAFFASFIV